MKRLATFGLAGMLALAGLGLFTQTSDASSRHHHRQGGSIEFYYGPYPYPYPYPAPYPYPVVRQYYRGLPAAHVAWCYDRYRSYRVSDNTFQPYRGWRRQCRSPYW